MVLLSPESTESNNDSTEMYAARTQESRVSYYGIRAHKAMENDDVSAVLYAIMLSSKLSSLLPMHSISGLVDFSSK